MNLSTRQAKRRLRELALWCRQLGMMLRTGTDLVAALSMLEHQDFSAELQEMTSVMVDQAGAEVALDDLIAARPDIFPPMAVFALRAGQARHRAPATLITLADCFATAADLGMSLRPADSDLSDAEAVLGDRAPVIRVVDSILREAANAGAAEIHICCSGDRATTHVSYAVPGEADVVAELPADLLGPICRRICIMAGISWHLGQPGLGTLEVGQRDDDPHGSVRFIPGERETDWQIHVNLSSPTH